MVDPDSSQERTIRSPNSEVKEISQVQDALTVMVFQRNRLSRSFDVPLKLMTRLGWTLAALVCFTILSGFYSVRFYRQAKVQGGSTANIEGPHAGTSAAPSQQEVDSLKRENSTLQSQVQALLKQISLAQGGPATSPSPNAIGAAAPGALPHDASNLQQPAAPPPGLEKAPTFSEAATQESLFSILPKAIVDSGISSSPPIMIQNPRIAWRGKTLKVHFNLGYTKGDGGNQQGRIILLARGKSTLLAYPDSVLEPAGKSSLVNPEAGEFFSVSRFREVKAEFTVVKGPGALESVEALILGYTDGNLKVLHYHLFRPRKESAGTTQNPEASARLGPTEAKRKGQGEDRSKEPKDENAGDSQGKKE